MTAGGVPVSPTFRRLLPSPGVLTTDDDLETAYAVAAAATDRVHLRANFVASVDGAAVAAGQSAGLSSAADKRVFGVLRRLADVVLVGAGTARSEHYGPATMSDERRTRRVRRGFAPGLPIAVVSNRLDLDPSSPIFAGARADSRTIVVTHAAAPAQARAALSEVADVVDCGATQVEIDAVLPALFERGLRRVLCEGGPTLFGELVGAGLVDELCLSVAPLIAGPGSPRIAMGAPVPAGAAPLEVTPTLLLESGGLLLARYVRRAASR